MLDLSPALSRASLPGDISLPPPVKVILKQYKCEILNLYYVIVHILKKYLLMMRTDLLFPQL